MSSIREEILVAIASNQASVSGVSGRVFRSRTDALERGECPAIIVKVLNDVADTNNTLGYVYWRMTVSIAVMVRGDVPDSLADAVVNSSYNLLMADPTLGSKCIDISPLSVDYSMTNGDGDIGVINCLYEVFYRTPRKQMEA